MNAGHRPLLVKHHKEGYRVSDIRMIDEQSLRVGPLSVYPALAWVDYRPLAVSPGAGACILGVGVVDPPADEAACIGMPAGARNTGPPPIMLPVGDDTTFTVPLPRPPLRTPALPSRSVSITSYFVMGTRVWISVAGEGTFSLDARLGAWRMEFPEEMHRLQLQGRAFFAPELGAVVGLTGGDRLLCSYKFEQAKDGSHTLTWHNTWREAVPLECFDLGRGYAPRSDMVGLAYLGDGRFCLCRPVKQIGARSVYSFLVLELRRRLPDGNELELAKRGQVHYQGLLIR